MAMTGESQTVSAVAGEIRRLADARRRKLRMQFVLSALVALLVIWSIQATIVADTDWERIGSLGQVLSSVGRFLVLDFSLIPHLWEPMLETFMMATLGTLLGLIFSLPVAWFGAINVTPSRHIAYPIGRFLMTLSRSIHEIVWALIFVAAVGLGALPGILAIAMRSIGFISKITAEAIENTDPKPVEAIRAMGGNRFQVMYYGILPQIMPVVLGTIIFEWDINIRRSAVMGLVGAGGLGLVFFRQMQMYNYGGVTMVIFATLLLIMLGEVLSHYARKAVT
jgi:phosphonate transport system permease protein